MQDKHFKHQHQVKHQPESTLCFYSNTPFVVEHVNLQHKQLHQPKKDQEPPMTTSHLHTFTNRYCDKEVGPTQGPLKMLQMLLGVYASL